MDLLNDVKLLVLLLGFLASTWGRPTGIANQGYEYNQKQESGGLDRILKAVLVHESTGNGLHSGSVSSAGGRELTVTKNTGPSSGYIYSASKGLKNIRVSHKSHGDTGYNKPLQRPEPHGFRDAPKGFTSAKGNRNHDQALKSIHESLFRSRSDENVSSRQSPFAPGPFGNNGGSSGYPFKSSKPVSYFPSAGQQVQNGYEYPKQSGYEYPKQSGYEYPKPGKAPIDHLSNTVQHSYNGPPSSGYHYPRPAQFSGENLSNLRISSNHIARPAQASYSGSNLSNIGSSSVQSDYSSNFHGGSTQNIPVPAQSPHSSSFYSGSTRNVPAQSPFLNSFQSGSPQNDYQYLDSTPNFPGKDLSAQSFHSTSFQGGSAAHNGYQYPAPAQNIPVHVSSTQSAHSTSFKDGSAAQYSDSAHVSSAQNDHSTSFQGGSSQNGYHYPLPAQNLKNTDFAMGPSVQATFSSLAQSLNGDSITVENAGTFKGYPSMKNEGYQYEKPVSMGYTYEKPAAAEKIAISQFVSSLAQLNSENEGYIYDKPVPAKNIPFQGLHNHHHPTIPSPVEEAPRQLEQPSQSSNTGYRYDTPVQNDGYHYQKPDSAKSVFKGQPYLPLPPSNNKYQNPPSQFDGYRYEKPDESSRPKTTFKGQAYLPLPVSGGL